MVERAPQTKQDEQYPLLKVDGGGGDGGLHTQPSPNLVTPGWGVTCSPKQSWLVRWPEYISACWMTVILLGISFLVFYGLGMEAYRRQPVLIIKCNSSKPASNVYYHHIVQRGSYAPFVIYAEYLSSMASQYPSLHFHLFFLLDDSLQNAIRGPRHTRLINHLISYPTANMYSFTKLDENKRALADLQRRYQNINVTFMSLSKYMAMTPLKYKWRTIPLSFLPFYARIFTVWQSGGIGMDLNYFNNNYNSHPHVDRRIAAILKQHNDGIQVEEYTNALNKIDREEDNENELFFTIFYGLFHQLFSDETRSFLSKGFRFPQATAEKGGAINEPLIRSNRNKREVPAPSVNNTNNKPENISNVYVEMMNSTNNATDLKKNEYQTLLNTETIPDNLKPNNNDSIKVVQVNASRVNTSNITYGINKLEGINKSETLNKSEALNKSDTTQLVLFYDLSVFFDGTAPGPVPSYVVPEQFLRAEFKQNPKVPDYGKQGKYDKTPIHLLSMDSEGMFVAASSRLHPILGHLISAGCQRMHPKSAILNTIKTQCSGNVKEDSYCNNIYIL